MKGISCLKIFTSNPYLCELLKINLSYETERSGLVFCHNAYSHILFFFFFFFFCFFPPPPMEVVVSAEDNAEVRRVSLTNNSMRTREIELTSYAEVVLNTPQTDAAHPAFSNLFIEAEFFAAENAILAHRRQRSQRMMNRSGAFTLWLSRVIWWARCNTMHPRTIPGPWPHSRRSDRRNGGPAAVEHHRRGARSGV